MASTLSFQSSLSLWDREVETACSTGEVDPYVAMSKWIGKAEKIKKYGQVFTPAEIAGPMARWVMAPQPARVLDPAVGMGNLLRECQRLKAATEWTGIEYDPEMFAAAKVTCPGGTALICDDYLRSDLTAFDGIIANPPYVKANTSKYSEDDWQEFEARAEAKLDRLTNSYALFLLKIWSDLGQGGRAAVLIPSEFLNANFGTEIKRELVERIRPRGLAVFHSGDSLFTKALTTSCVLFLEKDFSKTSTIQATTITNAAALHGFVEHLEKGAGAGENQVDVSAFEPADKWLNKFVYTRSKIGFYPAKVGDFFRCKRGIATGANDYFCLKKSEIASYGLDLGDFDACICRASDGEGLIFTEAKLRRLQADDKRCFLLNPKHLAGPVDVYLKAGMARGIHERFLPSHRPIWYLPENRSPASIWVAVFSRERVKYILNQTPTRNLTCYHGLYPVEDTSARANSLLLTLFLNSSHSRAAFEQVNRFYGDGLNKMEPKDVEAMPCPTLPIINDEICAELEARLIALDPLSEEQRQSAVDALANQHLTCR